VASLARLVGSGAASLARPAGSGEASLARLAGSRAASLARLAGSQATALTRLTGSGATALARRTGSLRVGAAIGTLRVRARARARLAALTGSRAARATATALANTRLHAIFTLILDGLGDAVALAKQFTLAHTTLLTRGSLFQDTTIRSNRETISGVLPVAIRQLGTPTRMARFTRLARVGSATTTAPARMGWHLLMAKEKNNLMSLKMIGLFFQRLGHQTQVIPKSFPPRTNLSRIDLETWERNQKIWRHADRVNQMVKRQREWSSLLNSISAQKPSVGVWPFRFTSKRLEEKGEIVWLDPTRNVGRDLGSNTNFIRNDREFYSCTF